MAEKPSRARLQLGAELRIMRELAGLTQQQMAARLTGSGHSYTQATVSRFESGVQVVPSRGLAETWADIAGADSAVRLRVLAFVEAVYGETRPWPDLDDAGHLQGVAARREEEALRIRDCSLTWIPGLCQTAEYMRHLLPQVDPEDSFDHAAAVVARLERQQILYREGRTFEFLLSEHALRWQPGPGVMVGQRAQLGQIATLADVDLRVLRSDRVGVPEWHNFVLYDPADGADTYVTTELLHGGQAPPDAKVVALYETLWQRLWAAALVGDEAVEFIRHMPG